MSKALPHRQPAQGHVPITAEIIGHRMCESLKIVMGWREAKLPPRFLVGSGDLRNLTIRVREQPINFMIIVNQSLVKANEGQSISGAGLKAARILLGEEIHPLRDTAQFTKEVAEEIMKFASDLNTHTNSIRTSFRFLRVCILELHRDLSIVNSKTARTAFLARLSRHLDKDIKNCEDALTEVHNNLEDIEESLDLITCWWQRVESEARYLQFNGNSPLVYERNQVTLKEVKDSFTSLEGYFADYLEKITQIYDENLAHLGDSDRQYLIDLKDCDELAISRRGRFQARRTSEHSVKSMDPKSA